MRDVVICLSRLRDIVRQFVEPKTVRWLVFLLLIVKPRTLMKIQGQTQCINAFALALPESVNSSENRTRRKLSKTTLLHLALGNNPKSQP